MEQKQRLTTKALIRRDNKVLLVCEANGNWELPGGKPNFGEHMEDAIKRELSEELHVHDIRISGLAGQFDFVSHCPKINTDYQFVALVFNVDIGEAEIQLSDEHVSYDWIAKDDIPTLEMKLEYKEFLKQIL